MNRLDEIEARVKAATEGPWRACNNGECKCGSIYAPETLIAEVSIGEIFETYPSLRFVEGTSSMDKKVEAYNEIIKYGRMPEDMGRANAVFIAHSPEDVTYLLRIARAAEALRACGVIDSKILDAAFEAE